MKYDTQSGLFVTVFWASVCSTTLTWPPLAEGGAFSRGGLEPMKWMATKATPATTAANAISSVVTRAGSDTGYHLVSLRHAMHTVAATAWPGPGRPGPTGKLRQNLQARCRVTHLMVTAERIGTQQREP